MIRLERIILIKDLQYTLLIFLQNIFIIAYMPQSIILVNSILEAQLVIQSVEGHPFSGKSTTFSCLFFIYDLEC